MLCILLQACLLSSSSYISCSSLNICNPSILTFAVFSAWNSIACHRSPALYLTTPPNHLSSRRHSLTPKFSEVSLLYAYFNKHCNPQHKIISQSSNIESKYTNKYIITNYSTCYEGKYPFPSSENNTIKPFLDLLCRRTPCACMCDCIRTQRKQETSSIPPRRNTGREEDRQHAPLLVLSVTCD